MNSIYGSEIDAIKGELGKREIIGVVGAPPESHSARLAALLGQHLDVEIEESPISVVQRVVARQGLVAGVVPLITGGHQEAAVISDGSIMNIRDIVLEHPRLAFLAVNGTELTATTQRGTSDAQTVAVVVSKLGAVR